MKMKKMEIPLNEASIDRGENWRARKRQSRARERDTIGVMSPSNWTNQSKNRGSRWRMRRMVCLYRRVWTSQFDKVVRIQFACAPVCLQPRTFRRITMIEVEQEETKNPIGMVSVFSSRFVSSLKERVWTSIIVGEMEGEQRLIRLE